MGRRANLRSRAFDEELRENSAITVGSLDWRRERNGVGSTRPRPSISNLFKVAWVKYTAF
jgi:hypothetical protein